MTLDPCAATDENEILHNTLMRVALTLKSAPKLKRKANGANN